MCRRLPLAWKLFPTAEEGRAEVKGEVQADKVNEPPLNPNKLATEEMTRKKGNCIWISSLFTISTTLYLSLFVCISFTHGIEAGHK